MTEEYASMKQIEFMKKLGFPPQSADLTKQQARDMIQGKLEERDKDNGKVDAPVVKVFGKMEEKDIKSMPTEAYIAPKEKEFHLSPEEVKCRALECAMDWGKYTGMTDEGIMNQADKFVKWIYGISK